MLFSGSIQDYVLLEKLNKLTVTKYSEMSDTAKTLITVMEELDKKCKILYECIVILNLKEEGRKRSELVKIPSAKQHSGN